MIGSGRSLGNSRMALIALAGAFCALLLGGCADVFFAVVDSGADTRNVAEHRDIVFDPDHGLALDAYVPRKAVNAPVVVFL
jgi:hypothetical protein